MLGETTRAVIDPKLRQELKDHPWIVDDERFFDRFFPNCGSSPPNPSRLPPPKAGSSNSNLRLPQCADAGSRLAIGFFITGRQNEMSTSSPIPRNCNRIGRGLTYRKISDDNPELVIRLASYARGAFGCQPGRRSIHAFTVANENALLGVCSAWRYWMPTCLTQPHERRPGLSPCILRLLNNQDLGLAGVQDITVLQTITCGRLSIQLRKPFFRPPAVVTMQQSPHFPTPILALVHGSWKIRGDTALGKARAPC